MLGRFLRDQRGDSIVEVLIAIGICSLVLVSAFVITNKSTAAIQANQERIEAQHLAESQIEVLRAQNGIATSGDCFVGTTETATCGNFTRTGSGATYTVKVTGPSGLNPPVPVGGHSTYAITVTWTSLGSKTTNDSNVTMTYRLN